MQKNIIYGEEYNLSTWIHDKNGLNVKYIQIFDPLFNKKIYHRPIKFNFAINNGKVTSDFVEFFYELRIYEYESINNSNIDINWDCIFENQNMNDAVSFFYEILNDIITIFLSLKDIKILASCQGWIQN